MKHFNIKTLLLAAGALLGFGSAAAQAPAGFVEVENWTESFASSPVSSSKFNPPLGWSSFIQGSSISYTSTTNTGYGIGTSRTQEDGNYDLIVTPFINGTLSFKVKRYASNSMYNFDMQLFKLSKDGDGNFVFNPSDEIEYTIPSEFESGSTSTSWIEQSVDLGADFTYVGIRLSEGYIDEFKADKAYVPEFRKLTLSTKSLSSGNTYNATEDGKVTFTGKFKFKNDGNVTLSPTTDENYSVSLALYYGGSIKNVIATQDIPELGPGAEEEFEVTAQCDVPQDITVNSSGEVGFNVYYIDNYNKAQANLSYVYVKQYKPIMNIRYEKFTNQSDKSSSETVDDTYGVFFGVTKSRFEKTFHLSNSGSAPLTISSVELPDGFKMEGLELPVTVEPSTSVDCKIVLEGTPGVKNGIVKFIHDGLVMRDQVPVSGEIVVADKFFDDFEDFNEETAMGYWFAPDSPTSWKVGEYVSSPNERPTSANPYWPEYHINDGRLENTRNESTQHDLYSPLMKFEEGDQISFYAAKKTNSGNDVKLIVKYSADRTNWTELGTITVSNSDSNLQFSSGTSSTATSAGQNLFKRFAFDMPVGEYYVGLAAGYVLVDNFVGGELVPVDYDIAPLTAEAGKTRIVNNPLTFSATFRNLVDNTIAAGDYSAVLYANGKKVAEAEADDFNGLTSKTFNFEYTPHVAGETELYAALVIGEYSVASPTVSVMVQEESATVKTQIGTVTKTENTVPLGTGYYNSKSEFVYTKEDLALLNNNSKILKISYPYYRSSDLETPRLTIWMENTTDTQVGDTFKSTEGLTEVYTTKAYTFEAKGSSTDLEEMEFVLDVPFLYEGNNLRVIIESAGQSSWNATSFGVDGSNSSRITRYYRVDSADTYEKNKFGAGSKAEYYPVINLYTEKELEPVIGTVKDKEGKALEGATVTVKATDGDVFYTAETDVDGNWSITIFQNELTYTVSADKAGYFASAPEALEWTASNDLELVEDTEEVPVPEEESVTSSKNDNELYDIVLVWKHSSEVKGVKRFAAEDAEYTYKVNFNGALHGTTNDNTYTISNVSTGVHTVEVIAVRNASGKESVAMAKTLDIGATGVADVEVEEGQYRYFNLNGVEVRGENLERGIYIRVKGKKAEKILVNN